MYMNTIKKILGLVWMSLAPAIIWFLVAQAVQKIGVSTTLTRSNVTLQWVIILTIFTPICVGFFIFGYYAFKGEYDQLPTSSKDLE
jgi:Na+/H+-dicarboxylate symporter